MNLFLPMLGVGLLTGFHCVTMCGSMVFSYSVQNQRKGPWLERISPQFAYHAAKILSYVTVGLALGAIGAAFNLAGIRPWATIVAGAFMILVGLQLTGFFPSLRKFSPRPPKFLVRAIMKLRKRATAEDEAATEAFVTPILFGLLTGLMPCGPLIAAELAAAGSGSPANGAIAMLGFGLGTVPVMLVFGSATSLISGKVVQKYMAMAAAAIVIILGVVFLNRGAVLLGSPVSFNTVAAAFQGTPAGATQATTSADGVAEVKLAIKNTQYVPSTVTIPAGVPVRLVVDRQENNACSDQIAIPQLGVLQNLAPNATTVVQIPATKAGTYNLTCGMGMMSGTLVATANGAGAAASTAAPNTVATAQQDSIVPPPPAQSASGPSCCGGGSSGSGASTGKTASATVSGGVQRIKVDVSQGYYDPGNIVLKAGVPTEITFGQSSGCTGIVQSQDLNFQADLTGGPATVKLQPLKAGTYGFACGMNMVHGTITVR